MQEKSSGIFTKKKGGGVYAEYYDWGWDPTFSKAMSRTRTLKNFNTTPFLCPNFANNNISISNCPPLVMDITNMSSFYKLQSQKHLMCERQNNIRKDRNKDVEEDNSRDTPHLK